MGYIIYTVQGYMISARSLTVNYDKSNRCSGCFRLKFLAEIFPVCLKYLLRGVCYGRKKLYVLP